ncbi:MAG: Spy/CpxP family protein refolding chaperone [Pyrinomonadaceae bacterium]|nr:Spy/CpxP family protein refolding chaperone [Pyrinomonadaceae bacterium]
MKNFTGKLALAAAVVALTLWLPFFTHSQAFAQEEDAPPPPPIDARPGDRPQPPNEVDLIRQLNLTPEQIKQIREIRESNADNWRQTRQRLGRARHALNEAIYADNASEADIEARAREVATAQTEFERLRALTELRIRRVLTAEQVIKLRELQADAGRRNRDQRQRDRREDPNAFQDRRRPNLPGDGGIKPKNMPPPVRPAGPRGRP